jgi:hypothetical protein
MNNQYNFPSHSDMAPPPGTPSPFVSLVAPAPATGTPQPALVLTTNPTPVDSSIAYLVVSTLFIDNLAKDLALIAVQRAHLYTCAQVCRRHC